MDNIYRFAFKQKKGFTIHLAPYRRETGSPFPIETIGYIPKKTDRVKIQFESYNFSFILKGQGDFEYKQKMYSVYAPCVLTQWPGGRMNYGPKYSWEELYFVYNKRLISALEKRGFARPGRPFWSISQLAVLDEQFHSLFRLLGRFKEPYVVDQIDLVCEMLILESLSHKRKTKPSRIESVIQNLEISMRRNILNDFLFDEVALKNGFHPATFRRYWNDYCPLPPAQFLMKLRMDEACRMLVETKMTINEIAYALKFNDPLYFSRKFKKEYRCTATAYRKNHQSGLQLDG